MSIPEEPTFETFPLIAYGQDDLSMVPRSYLYHRMEGTWEQIVVPVTDHDGAYPQGLGNYWFYMRNNYNNSRRSVDEGVTWTSCTVDFVGGARAVYYQNKPLIIAYDSAEQVWGVSYNFGTSFSAISLPEGTGWAIGYVTMLGELHAYRIESNTTYFYSYSLDLGETWSEPVQIQDPAPLPWVGGTIHQTSGRLLGTPVIHAHGTKIAFAWLEGWTEQYYTSGFDVTHTQFPGPRYTADVLQRYTPCDLIVNVSLDRGQTWSGPVRYKNDENQVESDHDHRAWGGSSAHGMGATVGYPLGAGLRMLSYQGDLYIFANLYEIYKRMGDPAPCGFIGPCWDTWEPTWVKCLIVYKAANWATPVAMIDRLKVVDGAGVAGPATSPGGDNLELALWTAESSYDDEHAIVWGAGGRAVAYPSWHADMYSLWEEGALTYVLVTSGGITNEFDGYVTYPRIRFWVPGKIGTGGSFWW